jgi:signal transduction histidine kinase
MENLIEGMTGITVERKVEGELGRVPSSVSLTAYRIVQEALTNAMRHSQATLVVIEVTVGNQLVVRVTDNGVGRDPNPGRGLTGMAERVELHRGTLRFGEAAGGGFELEARIPIENEQ